VRADEPGAGTRMAARELAVAGAEAFDKQDFVTALDRFQRAESLYKVPSIAVMVARCLARVGRVVEAVDKYEETLRMPLDPSAPEAFQRAVADATAEVEGVRARVARLELRVPAGAPPELEVLLDERPLPKALLGVPTPVNPGVHRIAAHAPGREPYRYDVDLAEGARQAVEITLRTERRGEAHARPEDEERQPFKKIEAKGKVPALSIGLFAGGGVALAVGVGSGISALHHQSNLDAQCSPGCPASMSSELDSFRLARALSYVGFGVGIVAAGAGTYFLLHEAPSGARVGALVTPGGAGLSGSF
jgi:hypothetical protein